MAQRSYPFRLAPGADPEDLDPELGFTTDVEFSAMFSTVFPSSILYDLEVTADSSGLNIKVSAGAGYVRGHFYSSSAIETLDIDAGDGSPRIDTIVLRLEYGNVNDIHLVVIKGTPASTPAPPTLTQTKTGVYELPLADVAVGAGAVTISPANVTDRRLMFSTAFQAAIGFSLVWSAITGKPSTFAPSAHAHSGAEITSGTVAFARLPTGTGSSQVAVGNHNHDGRYYTESEVDSLLDGKANSSHNHSASNITSGTLPQARGGTGASSASGARSALGVPAANGMSDVAVAQIDAGGGNNIGIYFNAGKPVIRVDATDFPVPNINDVLLKSGGTMTGALYLNVAAPVTSSYAAMYRNGDGRVGITPSARRFKKDITDHRYTVEDARRVRVRDYRLREEVFGSDDAPVEVGVIAEELIDAGLGEFVAFGEDGRPATVHYERLALVAIGAVQELASRVEALESGR